MSDSNRPPWFARTLELFANEHFDSTNAALLARSEWQSRQRLDVDERPSSPPGRMVGAERSG